MSVSLYLHLCCQKEHKLIEKMGGEGQHGKRHKYLSNDPSYCDLYLLASFSCEAIVSNSPESQETKLFCVKSTDFRKHR